MLVEVERDPRAQLDALAEVVACATLSARSDGELLIDRVLERGHGDPLMVAIVLNELGRRAGLPVGIIAGERGHFVAHQRLTEPLVLDPVSGRLVDADDLGTLRWQCGHQIAASVLDALQPRYERDGDLTRAPARRAHALHAAVRGHGRGRAASAPRHRPPELVAAAHRGAAGRALGHAGRARRPTAPGRTRRTAAPRSAPTATTSAGSG